MSAQRVEASGRGRRTFRIFLSSTAEDLKEHRARVAEALERLGQQTTRMEVFGARPGAPLAECRLLAAAAGALVVCVAHRYGWVPTREEGGDGETSITWHEVRAALDVGKPVFAFVVDPAAPWSSAKEQDRLPAASTSEETEAIVQAVRKLQDFKNSLQTGRIREVFTTPEDLALKVAVSVARWMLEQTDGDERQDERTRTLTTALAEAQGRHRDLTLAGDAKGAAAALAEALRLRRELREGGQLHKGDKLRERYELLKPLGQGGFATVWMAYDSEGMEMAAVKVLHPQYARDASRRERFFRGAREMARLSHPGIVRVLAPKLQDAGYHFFVMEYVGGGDLRQAVLQKRIGPEEGLKLLLEVGEALHHAHQQGVVHRDVKPANILLDGDGRPKLTDFDLVRAADTTGGTRTGAMLGTFLYTAPEMLHSAKEADVRADVYSLAMTACFVLHGAELPMEAILRAETFRDALRCPAGVKAALAKGTEIEHDARVASVSEFLTALGAGMKAPVMLSSPPKQRSVAILKQSGSEPTLEETRLLNLVAKSDPGKALAALDQLAARHGSTPEDLAQALGRRKDLYSLFKDGPTKLPEEYRSAAVLRAVEGAVSLLAGRVEDLQLAGVMAWVLDYWPGRSPDPAERELARSLRDEVVDSLRLLYPPPVVELRDGKWVEIPGGSFEMGSRTGGAADERPAHRVQLSSFRMMAHPVTNREYRQLVLEHRGEDNLPVVEVEWNAAYAYAAWLGGRLPTEAEWEYAARAGCPYEYCNRAGKKTTLDKVGWYSDNSDRRLREVMELEPNPWGLYDMYGNIWEWTADWWSRYSADPQVDPWGPPSGLERVMRGGSYWGGAVSARAARRRGRFPWYAFRLLGFRVALPVAPEP